MENEAKTLRDIVKRLSGELESAKTRLVSYEKSCKHDFAVVYNPIYTPAYVTAGDCPGTMGIDWQGPMFISARTEERWRRTCEKCGLVEYTTQTDQQINKVPRWNDNRR